MELWSPWIFLVVHRLVIFGCSSNALSSRHASAVNCLCGREGRCVGPIRSISTFRLHLHLDVPLICFAGILRGVSLEKRRSRDATRKCHEIDSNCLAALLWVPCLPFSIPSCGISRPSTTEPQNRITATTTDVPCLAWNPTRRINLSSWASPQESTGHQTHCSPPFGGGHSSSQLPVMDCMREESAIFEDVFCLCDIALLGCSRSSMERIQKQVHVGSATIRKELLLAPSWRYLSQHRAAISALLGL